MTVWTVDLARAFIVILMSELPVGAATLSYRGSEVGPCSTLICKSNVAEGARIAENKAGFSKDVTVFFGRFLVHVKSSLAGKILATECVVRLARK